MRAGRGVKVRVVLVKPRDGRNVGAVCRAMKTMGFAELYLVGEAAPDPVEAGRTAVHAGEVLRRAVLCPDLQSALRGVVLAAGVTRRRGRWRKYFALSPEQLAERFAALKHGTCALVFGNEASGLSDRELALCHLAVRIPSDPAFPSLNLSHAVQILTYQLFRRFHGDGEEATFRPVSSEELQALVRLMTASLASIGFFTQGDRNELGIFLRDILARAALEKRESERLARVFRRISGLITGKRIDSPADP